MTASNGRPPSAPSNHYSGVFCVAVKAHQATIKWSVPTNEGAALTGYQIGVDGKIKSTSAAVRKLVAKNLKTGKDRVQVRAIRALETGP
jgi:hypothetical protein